MLFTVTTCFSFVVIDQILAFSLCVRLLFRSCFQGPRGLLGPKGPNGIPGPPVSTHIDAAHWNVSFTQIYLAVKVHCKK